MSLGYHDKFVSLIKECVSSVSYFILLNGSPLEISYLHESRGLRQGDPLSPYLFIMGEEVLSRMLIVVEGEGKIHGMKVSRSALSLSHLFFANDSLIFCDAPMMEVKEIKDNIDDDCSVSGQLVNFNKSTAYFSNGACQPRCKKLTSILRVRIMNE